MARGRNALGFRCSGIYTVQPGSTPPLSSNPAAKDSEISIPPNDKTHPVYATGPARLILKSCRTARTSSLA